MGIPRAINTVTHASAGSTIADPDDAPTSDPALACCASPPPPHFAFCPGWPVRMHPPATLSEKSSRSAYGAAGRSAKSTTATSTASSIIRWRRAGHPAGCRMRFTRYHTGANPKTRQGEMGIWASPVRLHLPPCPAETLLPYPRAHSALAAAAWSQRSPVLAQPKLRGLGHAHQELGGRWSPNTQHKRHKAQRGYQGSSSCQLQPPARLRPHG